MLVVALAAAPLCAQRGKSTARDLFHAEAGLIVSTDSARRGRFAGAKKSVVAVPLGLRYRISKSSGGKFQEVDPQGPFQAGDQVRLAVETNDTGYLYIVHRQAGGLWRRLFPTSEIEGGNHFIRSGVSYTIPPEEGLELRFLSGPERIVAVLSRSPVKELEVLVSPRQPENTVSAAPAPEIPDSLLELVRNSLPGKELISDRDPAEKAVYTVNRSGKSDSLILAEIRLNAR